MKKFGVLVIRLNAHVESVNEGVCYTCDQCKHKATRASTLKRHVEFVHEGVCYPCDQRKHVRIISCLWTMTKVINYYLLCEPTQNNIPCKKDHNKIK